MIDLDHVGTWIDASVLNAELAGVLLLLATLWGWVLLRRVWLAQLEVEHAEALRALEARGFELWKSPLEVDLLARRDAVSLRFTLSVLRGSVAVVHDGAKRRTHPAPLSAEDVERMLGGDPPAAAAAEGPQSMRTAGDTTTSPL